MINTLIVYEGGKTAEQLKTLLTARGVNAVCENVDILADGGDSYDFSKFDTMIYLGKNADYVQKMFDHAKYHNYLKVVLAVSDYCYFNRAYPDRKLAEKHKYIAECALAEKVALDFCDALNVSIVELPMAEGEFPAEFVTARGVVGFDCKYFYLAPNGGTSEISPENAAGAIFATAVNGEKGVIYPICDKCRKYKDILKEKVEEKRNVYEYPEEFCALTAALQRKKINGGGNVPEFNLKLLYKELLPTNLFYDSTEVKKTLKYEELGL